MAWKLVVLTGFLAIAGAIIVASWKPWSSSGNGSGEDGGTKITSYATCLKSEAETTSFGPSVRARLCRAMGWRP